MSPVLRLRQAFRSVASEEPLTPSELDEVADEAADAFADYTYSRRESDERFNRALAEMRSERSRMLERLAEMQTEMSNLRNQILLGVLVIVGVGVAVLSLVIAFVD